MHSIPRCVQLGVSEGAVALDAEPRLVLAHGPALELVRSRVRGDGVELAGSGQVQDVAR